MPYAIAADMTGARSAGQGIAARIAADRSLGQRLDPELPYVWAEIEFAATHDLARTVEDVLGRRVPLLLVSRDQGLGVCERVADWIDGANRRVVRTIKARPIDLVDADRAAMLTLPPVPPRVGWFNQVRLGRDYYVRIDSNDYSVDPTAIGRLVTVIADLQRVVVRLDGRVVAVGGIAVIGGIPTAFLDLDEAVRSVPVLMHKTALAVLAKARAAGLAVVMDRCMMQEHRRLMGTPMQ